MAKSISDWKRILRECQAAPETDHTAVLQTALRQRSNLIVQRAAALIESHQLEALIPDLLHAYPRFLRDPSKTDNGCLAKIAICDALRKLGYDHDAFYLAGIHYQQFDPVFGPPIDSAAGLRAICGFALLENGYPRVMEELADLLADHDKTARAGAIRALASSGRAEGALLLRYKIHVGDESPEVMGECFSGLLSMAAETLPLVLKFIDGRELRGVDRDVRLEAALALGECGRPEAVEPLIEFAEQLVEKANRSIAYTALALSRNERATEHLLQQLSDADEPRAFAALQALQFIADQDLLQERLDQAMQGVSSPSLWAEYRARRDN